MKKLIFIIISFFVTITGFSAGPGKRWKHQHRTHQFRPAGPNFRPFLRQRRHRCLPGAICISSAGPGLYFNAGRFFCFESGFYTPLAVAPGLIIPVLPAGFRRIRHQGRFYFFCAGNVFRQMPGGFECVRVPRGLQVADLPEEELEQDFSHENEFRLHDNLWRRVCSESGVFYECLGPCGA